MAKLIEFDRLDEMGIETCSRSLPSAVVLTITGQRDDGNRILAPTAHLPGHFIPVHARQAEVEEHDVGLEGLECLERRRTVASGPDGMSVERERQGEALRQILVVLHEQDAARWQCHGSGRL